MAKGKGKGKSSGNRNDNRKCGKAYKQRPRKQRKTGRTIGGYSPAKLRIREQKRAYSKTHTPNETTIEALKEAEALGE
jgi:hypothetical protein